MRKPWNLVNHPVYSLATYDHDVNMNICTYVTPISLKPKLFSIAVYQNTKTLVNLKTFKKRSVLQYLSTDHLDLIKPLGKKSGIKFDKASFLTKNDRLTHWKKNQVLKNCLAYVELELQDIIDTNGDHELLLFKAAKSESFDNNQGLMFQDLIDHGLIL
ncbi:flavin reductase [Reichenbachiella versicolor]|uniref:flavin reductase n=1 Tax=Reichenbachiella versicolor TaxID=1821036 RepID=UPI000D6E7D1E|nr:flavin reductase [Reichenbachiella versicolor]